MEELTYSIWIFLLNWNRGSPRIESYIESKSKVNWEGCLKVKVDITALALACRMAQESEIGPCLWATRFRYRYRGDFSGDHGFLSVGTQLGWWVVGWGDAGVPAVFLDTCLNGVMVKESPPLRTVLSQAPRVLFLYFVLPMTVIFAGYWSYQLRWLCD